MTQQHRITVPTLVQIQAAALALVEARLTVILLRLGRKAPIAGSDGSWVTVADPTAVKETVSAYAQSGSPNIGIVLAPSSPAVAVDVDSAAAWPVLRELGVVSQDACWIARTGRGGYHIYYAPDGTEGMKRAVRPQGAGFDLLLNGYCVAPPSSTHLEGGGPYM